jgi:hypothetical protein
VLRSTVSLGLGSFGRSPETGALQLSGGLVARRSTRALRPLAALRKVEEPQGTGSQEQSRRSLGQMAHEQSAPSLKDWASEQPKQVSATTGVFNQCNPGGNTDIVLSVLQDIGLIGT